MPVCVYEQCRTQVTHNDGHMTIITTLIICMMPWRSWEGHCGFLDERYLSDLVTDKVIMIYLQHGFAWLP